MTRTEEAAPAGPRTLRIDRRLMWTATALGLAVVVITLDLSMVVRLPALLALLLLPGFSLTRLLLGESQGPDDRAERAALSVLLGVLVWLAVSLLLDALGSSLGTSLALGVGAVGLALVTLHGFRRTPAPRRSTPQSVAVRTTSTLRSGTSIAITAAVMVAAAAVAATMITKPVERYTTLGFVDNKPFAGEVPVVAEGEAVRLNWVLRGFGCTPSPLLTRVRLAVDGNSVGDVAVDTSASAAGTLTGAVTFTAPRTPGRHLVELALLPADEAGTPLPGPGYVSTFLEVRT
jgi:hypothetical protein